MKCCSWERDTGTSSFPEAAVEVALILNPFYFSGVWVM